MPELRKDPVVRRWVIIATERARRPGTLIDSQENVFGDPRECPFCRNADPEIFAVRDQGDGAPWQVKVVPNGTPIFTGETKFKRHGSGLYDVITNHGANEVVIETPDHIANMADLSQEQIARVIRAYMVRFVDLEKDTNLQYVFAYKNYGEAAGSRPIGHARSQIIATPVNPLRVKEKLVGAKQYFDYRDRCVYCDTLQQEIADGRRLICQSDHFVAMTPFAPRYPFEILVLPRAHCCDFTVGIAGKELDLAHLMKMILMKFKIGLNDPSYNYVIHTAPMRKNRRGVKWTTIEEDYHWHIELVPRLAKVAGFEKGTGFYICSIPPEETAEFLRRVDVSCQS